jgi:hypothetical protein
MRSIVCAQFAGLLVVPGAGAAMPAVNDSRQRVRTSAIRDMQILI